MSRRAQSDGESTSESSSPEAEALIPLYNQPSVSSNGQRKNVIIHLDVSSEQESSSSSPPSVAPVAKPMTATTAKTQALQLLFGAGGIYASFLYYGSLQEDVFRYISAADGTKFTHAWFLQALESLANVILGVLALVILGFTGESRKWWGGTPNLPKKPFLSSGFSQVCSKGFTSLALANGLSFPVATLAKSGKMAPVMIGSLILGGAKYNLREYMQVLTIIGGTAILSMGKKKSSEADDSTPLGIFFIIMALAMDGVTGGVQKRLLADLKRVNLTPQPYDLMTYTNAFMMLFALLISTVTGEFFEGLSYCARNPEVFQLIWKFSLCSAIGQSFIFYTVARFDPLVCSTVTTTRKIFSVVLSILFKGHSVSMQGWMGLGLAIGGILSEVMHKVQSSDKMVKSKTSM
mmetsp:Transcript_2132/g.4594  ORF Transcript_2132/g.4594 Transcript_2132/m.4594 type:complete len:406 (-) Transcript_2132:136-1353(-)